MFDIQKINFLRNNYWKLTNKELSEKLGFCEETIQKWSKNLGLTELKIQEPTELEKAYLAGLMDADGSISLYSNKKSRTIHPGITFTNANKNICLWFGKFLDMTEARKRERRIKRNFYYNHHLYIRDQRRAKILLSWIRPYLKIKKEQSDIVLEFLTEHQNRKITEKEQRLLSKIHFLNSGSFTTHKKPHHISSK